MTKLTKEIERRLAKLDALEAGGVDNWDFYSESLREWHKDNYKDECVDEAIESINEVFSEATVIEPAGKGAGLAFDDVDEGGLRAILLKLIKDIEDE